MDTKNIVGKQREASARAIQEVRDRISMQRNRMANAQEMLEREYALLASLKRLNEDLY